jgi:LuxR family transcriptional activator of conjugal transfer of Ti plasmids
MSTKHPFDPLIEAILSSHDPKALTAVLEEFGERHGFPLFAYLHLDGSRWKAVSNYPEDWQERYYRCNFSKIDPIVRAVRRGAHPFCWSLDDAILRRERPSVIAFRDEAIAYGIKAGFSIPIRVGFSHQAVLTFATDDKFALGSAAMLDIVEAAAAAAMLHVALTFPRNRWPHASSCTLSGFEVLCLRWIAEGKTMHDVADLLDQKYSRVRVAVDRARGKLETVTIQQTMAVAARMMLI